MTAEERRKKKEEEKAKVEEKKKVEEAMLMMEEKKKIEETNTVAAAAEISEESKKSEGRENENGKDTAVEQITLPYMKRRLDEGELENTGIEAFSYFSTSNTASKIDSPSIVIMETSSTTVIDTTTTNAVDTTFEESTKPMTSTTTTVVTAKAATFEQPTDNFESSSTFEEPSAASVVLEARAIVASVIGEASFISSFESSSSSLSKSVEDEDDDPLGEERNFSAVKREMPGSDSEANNEELDGSRLLEEIKEEIMREEKSEVEPSMSKKSSYQRPGTWSNIRITSNLLQNTEEEPLSPAEDKVKLLELRMMMEEMERMVEMLEEEMRDLQMRVEMNWMTLVVTLAS